MKELNKVIGSILTANSHCQMIKQFAECDVKHIEYKNLVSADVLDEVESYCKINDIHITRIEELLDVHMEHCTVRLIKK